MPEPDWLRWAREVQAIAQTGLAYVRDPFDAERYERLRALAAEMMADCSGASAPRIEALFEGQEGYATPKIDVRGAVFEAGRILMVREASDGLWTLPGGWADVNQTPAESAAREVREEAGLEVRVTKLVAAWDRTRRGHPDRVFSSAKLFYLCEPADGGGGGAARADGLETSEVGWFAEPELPADLSLGRVLPAQIATMFAHARDPGRPTEFD